MEKKVMKACLNNVGCVDIISGGGDDGILCEILSRVSLKSLMRFKSVCKLWHFLIQEDQYITKLHRMRIRSLMIIRGKYKTSSSMILRDKDKYKPSSYSVLTGDLLSPSSMNFDTITERQWESPPISPPVNGLLCFSRQFASVQVRIYNLVSGKEEIPWTKIGDTLWLWPHYKFVFDSATNEHKLICLWSEERLDDNRNYDNFCGVLTLGKGKILSWKMIQDHPPYLGYVSLSLFLNGSLYYIDIDFWRQRCWEEIPKCIVVFDMESEKFKAIPIPDFIIEDLIGYAIDSYDTYHLRDDKLQESVKIKVDLLRMDGRVALVSRVGINIVKLWIFDNCYFDTKKSPSTTTASSTNSIDSSNSQNWVEETLTLPLCWGKSFKVYFHSMVGKDDSIILRLSTKNPTSDTRRVSFYCCNLKKNSFTELEINGIPPSTLDLSNANKLEFATFFEGLLSIQK